MGRDDAVDADTGSLVGAGDATEKNPMLPPRADEDDATVLRIPSKGPLVGTAAEAPLTPVQVLAIAQQQKEQQQGAGGSAAFSAQV